MTVVEDAIPELEPAGPRRRSRRLAAARRALAHGRLHRAGDLHRPRRRRASSSSSRTPTRSSAWGDFFSDPGERLSASWDLVFDAYNALFESSLGERRRHQPDAHRDDAAALRRPVGGARLPGRAVQHRWRRPAHDGRHGGRPTSGSPSTCPPSSTCRSPSLAGPRRRHGVGRHRRLPQGPHRRPRGDHARSCSTSSPSGSSTTC